MINLLCKPKSSICHFKPEECLHWKAFLDKVFPDKGLQNFIQKLVGYSLTGDISEQKFFFLYGSGANGKSTFLEALRLLLEDYAQKTDVEALLQKRFVGGNTPYIARMKGARLLIASEIPNGKRLDEAKIKDLTGGDEIVATAKYQHPIEFKPSHKLWMVGNYKPKVNDTSNGFWRRIVIIPFQVSIPEKEQRKMDDLMREFAEEGPGILYWAVQGCLKWQAEGLELPDIVIEALDEYRSDNDIFQEFLK